MPPRPVSEASPIQVYLGPEEQARLAALAARLGTSKSDVIRRGLLALEGEVREPDERPILQAIGMFEGSLRDTDSPLDPARDHDPVLAEEEERSRLASPTRSVPKSRRRGRTR